MKRRSSLDSAGGQLDLPLPPRSPDPPATRRGKDREIPSSRLVESLASFCREHPLDEKVLVVPNRIVGRQLTDSAARALAPGGWIHLRAETLGSLAHEIAGEELAAEGRTTLSQAQRLAIVEKVCAENLTDSSYFGALRRSPGFHRALSRTIDELRAAGIAPEAISARSVEESRKAADLSVLLRAYENELRTQFADLPGILHRAIEANRKREEPPSGRWILLPSTTTLAAVENEFLRGLAGERLAVLAADGPDEWHQPENRYRFFRAVGEENEVREIFRRALSEGVPFDQIEVLYTDRGSYLSLAYELARQYDVPATFVDRIDVAYTRPGRAVLGFLDWVTSDFGERQLRLLLQSGALEMRKLSGSERLSAPAAARVLRRAKIGWGSARYPLCLKAYADGVRAGPAGRDRESEAEQDPERVESEARSAEAVARLARKLLAVSPVASAGQTTTLRSLALACKSLVGQYARSASELDGIAAGAMPRVLEDLAFLGDAPAPVVEAAARIREAIEGLFVGGASVTYPQPGKIHFAGLDEGGHSGRPHTFLIGLDESRHPGAGLQDPVLLDGERRRLNVSSGARELPMRGEAPQDRVRALRKCLSRLRGAVTLSFTCHDLAEDREVFPSAALVEVLRTVSNNPDADAASLASVSGRPDGYFPSRLPLDGSEWWLAKARDSGDPAAIGPAVAGAYPWLREGLRAREARLGARFTKWDGRVESAGTALDPRVSGEIVSASRLQQLADCPLAYFLKYVLRVEPPDEIERDPWNWLSPMDLGTLLHEVFHEFMEASAASGRKPSLEGDRARIDAIADAAIGRWRREVPPPDEAALERQRHDIRRACETFLKSEERETASLTPQRFEVGFGLGSGEPVAVPVGGGGSIRVRGSIDRVDLASDGSYEIWDYKTGSNFAYDPRVGLDGGRRLQHALYAAVFEEILRQSGSPGRVSRAGYIFTGPRGDGEREDFGFDRTGLADVLRGLCDLLREGSFPHGRDAKKCCAFCPYESVCGGKDSSCDAARRKGDSPENRGLAALASFMKGRV